MIIETPYSITRASDAWEEMITGRQIALIHLPGYAEYPGDNTPLYWEEYAQKCFEALLTFDEVWFIEPDTGIKGFRPYVKGTDGWGGDDRTRQITEFMAEMDVIWPMYRYLQLHPESGKQEMVEEFINELPKYYNLQTQQSTNRPGETRHDSWYFMENAVLKQGHLYLISSSETLKEPYLGNLTSAIEMAHNFNYLFPQFVNLNKETASGYNTKNYGTGGLLAYALIHAYQITDDPTYLEEAAKVLEAMHEVENPSQILYEPQELAAAAAAAAQLHHYRDKIDVNGDFAILAQDFFYAQLQAIYYNNGQIDLVGFTPDTTTWLPKDWRDGMFSPYYNPVESGGINAPAFKENMEAVLFWTDYLRYMYKTPGFNAAESLKILNLNRIKNFYFFSPNIPDKWEREYGPLTLQYIPYEDIDYYAAREYEPITATYKAGYNGKEIYGAGETLWAYLLFEALGTAEDPNALIVNLNVFDQVYPPAAEERVYIVFNPYPTEKTLNFTLKYLPDSYKIYADNQKIGRFSPEEDFSLTLPAEGSAYITLRKQ